MLLLSLRKCRIGVVGLGYVGLPLAVEFGKHFETVGFDVKAARIAALKRGIDTTLEASKAELKSSTQLSFSTNLADLRRCRVFIVTVPTPIDEYKRPDLTPLVRASESVGQALRKGAVVVYESTVYPGCTEEVCVPILERESGLKLNRDFFAGYSPERINPGDKEHRLPTIRKITSGSTPEAAEFVDQLYRTIIDAGIARPPVSVSLPPPPLMILALELPTMELAWALPVALIATADSSSTNRSMNGVRV